MKRGLTFIVNLIVLIAGVLLIAMSRNAKAAHTIVFLAGVAFVIPAVANMLVLAKEGRKSEQNPNGRSLTARYTGWLTSCGALALGLVMCFLPETFRSLFIYIFAIVLLFGGLYHVYMLFRGLRPATFPLWVVSLPLLMIVGAVAMLFFGGLHNDANQSTAILITGIGCVLFSATTFIEMICYRKFMRSAKNLSSASPAAADHQIEDVKAEEIK